MSSAPRNYEMEDGITDEFSQNKLV